MAKIAVFWFRRDLRLDDNTGFWHALKSGIPVLPVFIFDTLILGKLTAKDDARVTFIYRHVVELKMKLEKAGSSLMTFHCEPDEAFVRLTGSFEIEIVVTNHDYEPYAIQRDKKINDFLRKKNITFLTFKDQVIFEKDEVIKDNGEPYTVFTPYSLKWKKLFTTSHLSPLSSEILVDQLLKCEPFEFPSLKDLGFEPSSIPMPSSLIPVSIIENYARTRDIPSLNGTTRLGVHLRFGTISIRKLCKIALELSPVFLNELIWREFFISILWHFPSVVNEPFRKKYRFIEWRNDESEFRKWCRGETGYPMVDAGMREMNNTGFMHNRVRMVVASFLCKHLLVDWRWGEAYFAEKLLDFELSSNNGNWQWAAGCGCDAAPYFRIFNPSEQQKRFDPHGEYILKWIPEAGTLKYPAPIVDHRLARERALRTYRNAIGAE